MQPLKKENRDVVTVYIQGHCFADSIRYMLASYDGLALFKKAKSLEEADMVLYTGGADISPALYNEKALSCVHFVESQDTSDYKTYTTARKMNKFQVGICRGAQFLNVMNGGKLWQDVDNHGGRPHLVQDVLTKKTLLVSSLHHQGIILSKSAMMLAFAQESTEKKSQFNHWSGSSHSQRELDVEAFWYSSSRCLGVQWHPELMDPPECVDKFFEYIEKYRKEGND